jgi:ADP-L-glycero-D-manno-heptose 6-epimerase
MQKKFIVTGGAGFIGSNLIQALNDSGEENILVVDHLGNSEKWKNLRGLRFRDYMEKEVFLRYAQEGKELGANSENYLIHLGACSSTTETNATYLIQNNYEYSKVLCNYSINRKLRFLYASSAATYGLGENGYSDTVELKKLFPLNMYGYSKHLFDLYLQQAGLLEKVTGVKYFNIFGYGEAHKAEMRSVVHKGYLEIKSTGKLSLFKSYNSDYKDGEQKRDFLYVKDAVKITLHLLFGKHSGIYNIGRGEAETWNELGRNLFSALGKDVNIEYIEMPENLKSKYQYFTKSDNTKLLSTNYTGGFTSFQDSITEYVKLLEEEK